MKGHQITRLTLHSPKVTETLRFAVISDLHNGDFEDVLPQCAQCDAILVPGDLVNRHRQGRDNTRAFLQQAPKLAPTFVSLGNHELKCDEPEQVLLELRESAATLLDNQAVPFKGIWLGGLSSAAGKKPDTSVVEALEKQEGFRLLLCHHPEYFSKHVAGHAIDLTVAGHAHGGQIVLGKQGLFAPGQGWFPKWTSGFYFDKRLLVSRGMTNSAGAPRWHDPCEMLLLTLAPE